MSIPDYSTRYQSNKQNKHAPYFHKQIFCVIAGSTGSGKTNLITHFLLQPKLLNYSDVYIYSPTIYQPIYRYLKQHFAEQENLVQQKHNVSHKMAHFIEVNDEKDKEEELADPSSLDPSKSHVIIFDDCMNNKQTKIIDYFCRGRHNNVNIFYLCQSLHKIAKHCIRQNANTFILFKQDDKTLKYFWETHCSGDLNFKEFKSFCDDAWTQKHGFAVINLWEESYCGRYVSNYNDIYTPEKYRNK